MHLCSLNRIFAVDYDRTRQRIIMDTRVTIIKQYRNRETLRLMETENLVEAIRSCQYQEGVDAMRLYYPIMKDHRSEDGTLTQFYMQAKQLPRICIALQMETVNQSRLVKGYSGLVLLEVNNLPGTEEAEAVRRGPLRCRRR